VTISKITSLLLLLFMITAGNCQGVVASESIPAVNSMEKTLERVSSYPVLRWKIYPDAVIYELDISLDKDFSAKNIVFHSTSVYVAGYQPDLSQWQGKTLFYRLRPLNYDRQPIDKWSSVTEIQVDYPEKFDEFQPVTVAKWSEVTPILYPAYSWIPVFDAGKYKVEIFSVDKAATIQSNRYQLLSSHQVDGGLTAEWYDEVSRVGNFAWRVQAFKENGQPIGLPSAFEEFTLKAVPRQFAIGVYGDSIMHGGGAVSGSPADLCYSLHAYLGNSAINLAKSGDISATSLERFDKDVLPFSPQTLLILTGINSIRGGEKSENVIRDLTGIYNKCLANNITPVFLTLLPVNPARINLIFQEKTGTSWSIERNKVNQYIVQNLPCIDIAPLFTDSDGIMPVKWSTDGLHPDSKAKKLIADMFKRSRFNNVN